MSSRVSFAFLGFSSIMLEIGALVERGRFMPANFFSYFTVESNLLAVLALLLSALALGQLGQSMRLAMLRGASTLCMLIVGVVFPLLVASPEIELTAIPWDNIVLHYIMPVAIVVDWFVDIPRSRIPYKAASVWLLFPIAYVAYSVIRGSFTGWYPYPFLNPGVRGAASVAVTCIGLTLLAAAMVWALTTFAGRSSAKADAQRS